MKTAYVTGGTGCLGRNLITVLLREGWRVIIAHRQTSDLTPLKALPLETREVILEDSASVLRSLPYGIEAVFHVAAHLSHWARQFPAQYQTNVCGTRTLVDAALTQHVGRFVYTSTGATRPYESWDGQTRNVSRIIMSGQNALQNSVSWTASGADSTP